MNKFTKKTSPQSDGVKAGRTETPWVAGLIFKMALIMTIIFGAFLTRVHLNDKTERLAGEGLRIRRMIEEKRTEIQTLTIQKASLSSWDNISAKIRQYNLSLHAVNPAQVRYMKRFAGQVDSPYPGDTRVASSAQTGDSVIQ